MTQEEEVGEHVGLDVDLRKVLSALCGPIALDVLELFHLCGSHRLRGLDSPLLMGWSLLA